MSFPTQASLSWKLISTNTLPQNNLFLLPIPVALVLTVHFILMISLVFCKDAEKPVSLVTSLRVSCFSHQTVRSLKLGLSGVLVSLIHAWVMPCHEYGLISLEPNGEITSLIKKSSPSPFLSLWLVQVACIRLPPSPLLQHPSFWSW